MKNFFSHSYSSKFSFFTPDHNILFPDSPRAPADFNGQVRTDANVQGLRITKALTVGILATFTKCNPSFTYNQVLNPKRCLTFPAEGVYNDGYDNINNEYILYVNDIIKSPENHEYKILELLGKGTFGQVIKCLRKGTNEEFALKVIKNKPAYTNQALSEIKIYRKIKEDSEKNENYVVRLYDYFVFRNHICILMEILHISLFDLLEMSSFSGFSLKFVARLTHQILEGMACLEKNKIIHCDLKPENILFADDQSDIVKLIDLGSSCFVHSTLYTYIQSRFYRAPEVILGMKYTNKIDSWSLGCIAAEFYLGLPLFPGSSEYDQLKRIIDILGMPENDVIELGRFKNKFLNRTADTFVMKTVEEFQQEQNVILAPHKKYFILTRLEDLDMYYSKSKQREKQPQERQNLPCFIHFLKGLLTIDPHKRWSASQALRHPFLTNEDFDPDWDPPAPEQALGTFENQLLSREDTHSMVQSTFLGFSPVPTESLNPESYRPFVPPTHTDKKEEVISQNQNVYLLNNQANSNKPKGKLNPKASAFNTNTFHIPALNPDGMSGMTPEKSGSHSEPNSARSLGYKPKNSYGQQNGKNKGKNNNHNNNYTNSAKGKQNDNNNDSWAQTESKYKKEQRKSQQYHPNQFGYNNSHQNDFYQNNNFASDSESTSTSRYRSNSDHGTNDKIYFNKKSHKKQYGGNKPPQNRNQMEPESLGRNQLNSQDLLRNQPTPDTAETSNSSNEFEFKNKFNSTGHNSKPSQQDETKEEFKEEELL